MKELQEKIDASISKISKSNLCDKMEADKLRELINKAVDLAYYQGLQHARSTK